MRRICIALGLALILLIPGASPAQTRSNLGDVQFPALIAVADQGVLTIFSNPAFTGCTTWLPTSTVLAQPGMDLWAFFFAFEDADGLLPIPPITLHATITPKGAVNAQWHETVRASVYTQPGRDLVADFLSNPCAFYETGPLVAEGLMDMLYESADDGLVGPGANSWGLRLKGILQDTAGECASGNVEYQLLRRWVQFSDGPDYTIDKVAASKGPSLTCTR